MKATALRATLFLRRQEPLRVLACGLIVLAIAAATVGVPGSRKALADATAERDRAVQAAAANRLKTPAPTPENRLLAFRTMLGSRSEAELHVAMMLEIARDKHLTVQKAQYRAIYSKPGNYHMYQANLPFRSGYEPVRAFCDEILRAFPFASIDSVQFSRGAVDTAEIDTKVTLTFYLAERGLAESATAPETTSAGPIATRRGVH